jgi:hypothetical protein
MADPHPAEPVKLIIALMWGDAAALELSLMRLRREWGDPDFIGEDHPFDATRYYEAEMGLELRRRLVSFARLAPPESIREAKLACNKIENDLARDRCRRVNLDVGYLDHNKIVLASAKYAGQKIHLGDGIYADLIARFRDGRYAPFEWTFPDFRDGRYDRELKVIRSIYAEQIKVWRDTAE